MINIWLFKGTVGILSRTEAYHHRYVEVLIAGFVSVVSNSGSRFKPKSLKINSRQISLKFVTAMKVNDILFQESKVTLNNISNT